VFALKQQLSVQVERLQQKIIQLKAQRLLWFTCALACILFPIALVLLISVLLIIVSIILKVFYSDLEYLGAFIRSSPLLIAVLPYFAGFLFFVGTFQVMILPFLSVLGLIIFTALTIVTDSPSWTKWTTGLLSLVFGTVALIVIIQYFTPKQCNGVYC
jgi:hypothetical protein